MTYDPNVPPADQRPSVSQPIIQNNFKQLNDIFNKNHFKFNAADNAGKHRYSTYVEQGTDPSTNTDEGAVYTKDESGRSELFYRYQSSGDISQLTWIKAWCRFDGTLTDPIAIVDGYNVTNVTKLGSGSYQINFATPLGNTNYAVVASTRLTIAGDISGVRPPRDTAFCVVQVRALTSPTTIDSTDINVLIIGT